MSEERKDKVEDKDEQHGSSTPYSDPATPADGPGDGSEPVDPGGGVGSGPPEPPPEDGGNK